MPILIKLDPGEEAKGEAEDLHLPKDVKECHNDTLLQAMQLERFRKSTNKEESYFGGNTQHLAEQLHGEQSNSKLLHIGTPDCVPPTQSGWGGEAIGGTMCMGGTHAHCMYTQYIRSTEVLNLLLGGPASS